MVPVSGDKDELSFFAGLLHDPVDFFYEGTGGVCYCNAGSLHLFLDAAGNSVGADDHGALPQALQLLLRSDNPDPFLLQFLYYLVVVDDGPIGINGLFPCLQLLVYLLYRPFYSEAEPGAFGNSHLHINFLSLHSSRIFSVTSSIVRSDESSRTASSAWVSGEAARWVSW